MDCYQTTCKDYLRLNTDSAVDVAFLARANQISPECVEIITASLRHIKH